MKIKVKGNWPKTIDGEQVGPFRNGEERDLDDKLAQKMLDSGMAEHPPAPPVKQTTALGPAPENKAADTGAAAKKGAKKVAKKKAAAKK